MFITWWILPPVKNGAHIRNWTVIYALPKHRNYHYTIWANGTGSETWTHKITDFWNQSLFRFAYSGIKNQWWCYQLNVGIITLWRCALSVTPSHFIFIIDSDYLCWWWEAFIHQSLSLMKLTKLVAMEGTAPSKNTLWEYLNHLIS